MKPSAALLAMVLAIAACSQTTGGAVSTPEPEPEPTLDPVGTYDFMTDVEGQTITGTMTITGSPGAYSGSITSDMGAISLRNIVIDGMDLTFVGDSPDFTVAFALTFSGDSFTGEWDAGGLVGFISGSKR